MGWRDTIQDDAPTAAPEPQGGPLRVTIPTAENLANATNKQASSWRDTVQEAPSDGSNPFWETFKQGASNAGNLISDSAKFLTGNEVSQPETPMLDVLRKKHQDGTADRHDYERAFLEGMNSSPGGKLLGAMGGMIPSANVVTTAIGKWVNPYIENKTGIDPAELQLGEMAALPAAGSKLRTMQNKSNLGVSDLPVERLAGTIGQKAVVPAVGAAVKMGTSALGTLGRPLINGLVDIDNPITDEPGLNSAFKSPEAVEGARLQSNIPGLNFSAGEMTGNPRAKMIEDALANSGKWGGKFETANQGKIDAIVNKYNGVLDQIHNAETVPDEFGSRLSDAYRGTLDSLKQTRREQAKIDFDTAYDGADAAGRYIQSNNLFRTLQQLREEGDARLLTSSKALGGKMGRSLLNKLAVTTQKGNEMADNVTIKELGNGLSDFGEAAGDRSVPDAERRVYARLYDSLQKDLDAEISNPKGDPERVAMLAKARDNYKGLSDQISDVQKTTLGNVVGFANHNSQGQLTISPEAIAGKFNSLQPSELKATLKFLDDNHPDVANMGRRYMLESVLRKAEEGVGMQGVGTARSFAKTDFVKSLPTPDKLNALLGDTRAYDDVTDVAKATNRLREWGASQSNSRTAQRLDVMGKLMGFGKGMFIKSVVSDQLAQDLLDPSKRHRIGVEARQTQKLMDTLKAKGSEFMKDQTGAMVMDFGKAKQHLEQMRPRNDNSLTNQTVTEAPELSTSHQMEWLRDNHPPQQIKQWELESGRPLEHWDHQEVDDLYQASQPTLKGN